MQPSNSTWTWTLIQTFDPDQIHFLYRSPDGRLLFPPYLSGIPFSIKAHNFDRGEPASPRPDDLRHSHPYFQVELGPDLFMATCLRPDGTPELPRNPYKKIWYTEKQPDGSWRFLSTRENVVMETSVLRCWTKDSIPPSGPKDSVLNSGQKDRVLSSGPKDPVLSSGPKDSILSSGPKDSVLSCQAKEQEHPKPEVMGNAEGITAQTNDSTKNAASTEANRSGNFGNSGDYGNFGNPINPKLPNYQVTQLPNSSSPNSSQLTQLPNPTTMMDNLQAVIRQHLVCTQAQSTVLALWILHTYTYRAAPVTPYLNISSRIEESGKSTCMTILRSLCAQPWWAAGISRSACTRKIIADHPTVLLDNWHTVFSSSDKTQMTGFLLTGCDQPPNLDHAPTGSNYPITNLPNYPMPFCPKAFAGPDPLPQSLARRSIPIVLQRPKPTEIVKRAMNLLAPGATTNLTSWMQEWARANWKQIETTLENSGAQSQLLPGLTPHQQSSAKVLIGLANTIGEDWSQKAHAALPEVFKDAQQIAISLLSDIRDAFAHHGNPERIFTAELLDRLHDLDHRTWHEWGKKGEPMTPHALSVILRKSFGIYSRSQRRGEDKRRGYQLSDFIEAWERYLPTQAPQNAPDQNAPKEHQETSVAATSEIVRDNRHARRRAEVARTEVSQKRAEVARTEVSQKRAEVRQRARTAVHPAKPRFISMSRLTAGCRRIANRFGVKWF